MEAFHIRRLTEADIRIIVERCGGEVAHLDADRRSKRGSDFVVRGAAIELKLLDEDGFQKLERQTKLAKLFNDEGFRAPVVVLDREKLSSAGQRTYDRAQSKVLSRPLASSSSRHESSDKTR